MNSKKPSRFLTEQSSIFTTNYNYSDMNNDEEAGSILSPTKSLMYRQGVVSATSNTEMIESESNNFKSSAVYLSRSDRPAHVVSNNKIKRLRHDIITKSSQSLTIKWLMAIYSTIALMLICMILLKTYYNLSMDHLAAYQKRINMMAGILRPSGFFLRGCTVRLIEVEKGIDKSTFLNHVIYYRDHNFYFYDKLKNQANVLIESFQTQLSNLTLPLGSKHQ